MQITLETIKAEQQKLADLIAQYETQPFKFDQPISITFPKLNAGEKWVGVIISADGTKREHIILLPGEFTGNWKDSLAWAESIGGQLFDRVEGALLFATMNEEFKSEAYWTREQHASDSNYAWLQYFGYGLQHYSLKRLKFRARALRRLEIL